MQVASPADEAGNQHRASDIRTTHTCTRMDNLNRHWSTRRQVPTRVAGAAGTPRVAGTRQKPSGEAGPRRKPSRRRNAAGALEVRRLAASTPWYANTRAASTRPADARITGTNAADDQNASNQTINTRDDGSDH